MAVRRRRQMILVNCMFAVGEILQRRHSKMLRRLVKWKLSVGWCSYCRMIEGSLIFIRMTPELCISSINHESFPELYCYSSEFSRGICSRVYECMQSVQQTGL